MPVDRLHSDGLTTADLAAGLVTPFRFGGKL